MKMLRTFCALGLSIASGLTAFATQKTCKDINLSASFGAIRDSGDARWCWANASADYIGFFQGVKPPEQISSLDVAVSFFSGDPAQLKKTLSSLNDPEINPVLNEWVESSIYQQESDTGSYALTEIGIEPALAILNYQSRPGYCLESSMNGLTTESSNAYIEGLSLTLRRRWTNQSAKRCFSPEPILQLEEFNFDLNKKIIEEIRFRIDSKCQSRVPMKPMVPRISALTFVTPPIPATDLLDEKLSQRLPAIIEFDINVFKNESYSKKGNHAALVIGSRENTGSCEYLVRDSNGSDCHIYKKSLQPRCTPQGLWLTTDEINNSTSTIVSEDGVGTANNEK